VAEIPDQLSVSVDDEHFMAAALEEARAAAALGEVPIGAVVVRCGEIVARAGNRPVTLSDPTAHAEILALRETARMVGNYRLDGCTLYVTLEPCPMCAGALVHARVDRLVFGARDLRFGGVRTKIRIADSDLLNHAVEVVEGVRAADCLELLQSFFRMRREL
jgi:tRNA(adenine34) deaminase